MKGLTLVSSSDIYGVHLPTAIAICVLAMFAVGAWIVILVFLKCNPSCKRKRDLIGSSIIVTVGLFVVELILLIPTTTENVVGYQDVYTIDDVSKVNFESLIYKYDSIDITRDTLTCTDIYKK